MLCDKCNQPLIIAKSTVKSELDSTDVFSEQVLVCTNPMCEMFAGIDLNNPKHVCKTISNKIN